MSDINKLRNDQLKKPILLFVASAILVSLPEFTWTYYPDGVKSEGINFEDILDGIFYVAGVLIAFKAALYFKETSPPE